MSRLKQIFIWRENLESARWISRIEFSRVLANGYEIVDSLELTSR